MENINQKSEKIELAELANTLTELDSKENGGRGVSCVKTIIMYLQRGDIESVKAVMLNEGDKIRNYPEIETMLKGYFKHPSQ